jgi:hypothetical protein
VTKLEGLRLTCESLRRIMDAQAQHYRRISEARADDHGIRAVSNDKLLCDAIVTLIDRLDALEEAMTRGKP